MRSEYTPAEYFITNTTISHENAKSTQTKQQKKKTTEEKQMFAASRNINVSMTTRMMAHQQRAVRRCHRNSPSSSSNNSSSSSRSGTNTPKASNVAFRSTSDMNFEEIWGDLVADHKIFPTEGQSSHHPSQVDILQSRLLGQEECQVGKSDFEEGRARATN